MKRFLIVALPAFLTSAAGASNIYMLSSSVIANDTTIASLLTARGHTVTIGVDYGSFNGTVDLSAFDTVYLQCNANWATLGAMPIEGQQQLLSWVNAGGRLVTSEWVIYYTYPAGKFELLEPIIPALQTINYGSVTTATFTQVSPHAVINAGLPTTFEVPLTSFTGTETYAAAKSSATVYYSTSNGTNANALCGWRIGEGSVFSFTSTCGPDQVNHVSFGRLFANVMGATATGSPPCYANCDGSTGTPALTANDFQCFINAYAANLPSANCDGSTGSPALTANDFQCFINKYAAGCP